MPVIAFRPSQDRTQWTQETGDSMRRKRFMKGSVRARWHGKTKVWVGQWWENGHRRSKVLGKCSEMTKGEAEVALNEIIGPLNRHAGHRQVPIHTLGKYLDDAFLPACRRKWKESTRMTTEERMVFHLKPEFGERLLRTITREEMQAFLDQKAQHFSQRRRSPAMGFQCDFQNGAQ